MKKMIIIASLFLAACGTEPKQLLEYDANSVVIEDTVKVAPHDRYYQEITVPTRKVSVLVDIHNDSDSAKSFIVNIHEQ